MNKAQKQDYLQRDAIIKKWEKTGLLNNYDGSRKNIAQLYESQASSLLSEKTFEVSTADTISYFENRVAGARTPERKIRPMQHLILIMASYIRKKHCQ